jgi:Family of unknown function (DUF6527)
VPKFTCIENTTEVEEYCFICPGCHYGHWVRTRGPSPVWQWNSNVDKPTVSPSLNVDPGGRSQCHSFITDGKIQFLGDYWHELKGKTVEIPDWETEQPS